VRWLLALVNLLSRVRYRFQAVWIPKTPVVLNQIDAPLGQPDMDKRGLSVPPLANVLHFRGAWPVNWEILGGDQQVIFPLDRYPDTHDRIAIGRRCTV
jgi:hypothetical protein